MVLLLTLIVVHFGFPFQVPFGFMDSPKDNLCELWTIGLGSHRLWSIPKALMPMVNR